MRNQVGAGHCYEIRKLRDRKARVFDGLLMWILKSPRKMTVVAVTGSHSYTSRETSKH